MKKDAPRKRRELLLPLTRNRIIVNAATTPDELRATVFWCFVVQNMFEEVKNNFLLLAFEGNILSPCFIAVYLNV